MPSNFEDVQSFHRKYGLDVDPGVGSDDWLDFREDFMSEELDEFHRARMAGDRAGMFDALLDLAYVAMGTADGLRFPWQRGWDRVQRANMAKVRVDHPARSKRGSAFDVVKPAGWTAPDHSDLVDPASQVRCPGCGRVIGNPGTACYRGAFPVPGEGRSAMGTFCDTRGRVFIDKAAS